MQEVAHHLLICFFSCLFFFFFFSFSSFALALATCFGYAPFPRRGRFLDGAEDIEDGEGENLQPVILSNEEEVEEEEEEEEELLGIPNLQALHRRFLPIHKEHLDFVGQPRLLPLIYDGILCAINILKVVLKEVIQLQR